MHRTHLTAGDDGSTVHTNKPLSQPTTKTEPDRGLEKDEETFQCLIHTGINSLKKRKKKNSCLTGVLSYFAHCEISLNL